MSLLSVFIASVCLTVACVLGQQDQTVEPGAFGSAVVEAVCSLIESSCVFPEDKLFTRRLAYVESHDGRDLKTFRPGYYGGIWQVDQAMFNVTQSVAALSYLKTIIDKIKASFGIEWQTVRWEDLTKPLHSALAARLYIQYNSRNYNVGIPRSIEDQADFWVRYYRPQSDRNEFITEANRLEEGCTKGRGADIVFVLDGSGSVGVTNFETMKAFVSDVINSFDIGPGEHQYRIGVIQYSTIAVREFDLNRFYNKSQVIAAVMRITYKAGWTYTNLALDEMVTRSFTAVNGARPTDNGHPHIGIVVTDGQSTVPQLTKESALRAHAAQITMFSVGVGSGVNVQELDIIASPPVCLNRFLLQGFTDFDGFRHAIEKRTCEAPIIISPGSNSTTGIPAGGDQNCQIKVTALGVTIELISSRGRSTFFVSKTTYPSSEYFDMKTEATQDRIGFMFIPKPVSTELEGIVYCNIKGDNITETNVSISTKPGDHDGCKNQTCHDNGECVNTPGGGYRCDCDTGFIGQHCEHTIPLSTTLSTTTTSIATEPTTTTASTTTASTTTASTTTASTTTASTTTASTTTKLLMTTKPTTTTKATTTITTSRPGSNNTYNCDDRNPCTPENINSGKHYFPHDNPNLYVQCSNSIRQCFVLSCGAGLVWNAAANACDWP